MKYNLKNKFEDAQKFSTLSFRSILLDHKHHHQRLFSFLHYRHHIVVDKCLWYRFEGHNESRQRWIERIWKLELGNDRMSGHRWQKWINLNSWLKMGVFFYFSRPSSSRSKLSRQLWNICMTLFGTSRDVIAWIICYLVKVLVLYHIHQRSIQSWYHNQRYLLVLPSIFAFWWRYRRSVHLGEGRLIK